jgi:hypothetical protein
MPVRFRLFFMRIRIWIGSESAIISLRLDIIANDSNVVLIPVIEVLYCTVDGKFFDASPDPTFFYADPDLDFVPIRNHDIL